MNRVSRTARHECRTGARASGQRSAALLVGAVTSLAGCAGESAQPGAGEAEAAGTDDGAAAVTPAIYETRLAFLSFGAPRARLFLELENRTSAEALDLEYGGWWDSGDGWRTILDVTESTTVPRAAWRILPVGPLRVSVTDGEELAGLGFDDVEGGLRLRFGEGLAEWASVTGQRESLIRAVVQAEDRERGGILLTSQTARVAGAASRGGEHAILLADSLGNAIVILRSGFGPDAPVVVHTLLGDRSRRWDGAELSEDDRAGDDAEGADPDGTEVAGQGGAAGPADSALAAGLAGVPDDLSVERYRLVIPGAEIEALIALQTLDSAAVAAADGLPVAFASVMLDRGDPAAMSGYQVALSAERAGAATP